MIVASVATGALMATTVYLANRRLYDDATTSALAGILLVLPLLTVAFVSR